MQDPTDTMCIKMLITDIQKRPQKTKGGINSLRADNCAQLLVFMGEDKTLLEEKALERATPGAGKEAKRVRINKRIKYWLGRTRKVPADEIYNMMRKAKDGKQPQALFNWLLKKKLDTMKACHQEYTQGQKNTAEI